MRWTALLTALLLFSSCCRERTCELDPVLCFTPYPFTLAALDTPFPPLTEEEMKEPWGQELVIAYSFADDLDLYRMITSLKRAKALIPKRCFERRFQIDYGIMVSYYFAQKYQSALNTFEGSYLKQTTPAFPAYRELLVMLRDSYTELGYREAAINIMEHIAEVDAGLAQDLELSEALRAGDLEDVEAFSRGHRSQASIDNLLSCYRAERKSPLVAERLSTFLPGAGYYYVGQTSSAITSFLINTLFIWATIHFAQEEHWPAALITAGFEAGWYFGGINGSGLAAQEYNNHLYNKQASRAMRQECLFPLLMFEIGF